MIKWFCDFCGREIEEPKCPVRLDVHASPCNRNLDGWGETIFARQWFVHEECAYDFVKKVVDKIETQ